MLKICQTYVLFIAVTGFILGQLFFGQFDLWSNVTGFSGIIAVIIGIGPQATTSRKALIELACCVLALVGVLMGAIDYYLNYNIPGNDYAWEFRGPYLLALFYMTYSAFRKSKIQATKNTATG